MNTVKTKRIKIKDLKIGDKIKTMQNGVVQFKIVTDKFFSTVQEKDQVQLEFENGVVLNCSTKHPIMVGVFSDGTVQKQVLPLDLKIPVSPEDSTVQRDVISDNYNPTRLVKRVLGGNNNPEYIDITVQDTHTFFTSDSENGPMVLTHNSQGGVRNACLRKDTNTKIVDYVEIDGIKMGINDEIIYNFKKMKVRDVLNLHATGAINIELDYF